MRRQLVIPAFGPHSSVEMPALSALLRRADRVERHPDWRRAVLARVAPQWQNDDLAPAVVVAALLGDIPPSGTALCLASPVHVVAGMSRVHLHDCGQLILRDAERDELIGSFRHMFGDEAIALHTAGDALLLRAPFAAATTDDDPGRLAGQALERQSARNADERALRLLGAELEMWLASLALNQQRERRGELPVNGLWLWGGGRMPDRALAAGASPPLLACGTDIWFQGLMKMLGCTDLPVSNTWDELPAGDVICQTSDIVKLESDWFAPALRDLKSGRLRELELLLDGDLWRVHRRSLSLLWRRPCSWSVRMAAT
jgi:hypothetical protein